jgi:hypothetical protein
VPKAMHPAKKGLEGDPEVWVDDAGNLHAVNHDADARRHALEHLRAPAEEEAAMSERQAAPESDVSIVLAGPEEATAGLAGRLGLERKSGRYEKPDRPVWIDNKPWSDVPVREQVDEVVAVIAAHAADLAALPDGCLAQLSIGISKDVDHPPVNFLFSKVQLAQLAEASVEVAISVY